MRRYKYQLLPLFGRIAGAVSGSDDMTLEEAREIKTWLEWRITSGWASSANHMSLFDGGVRVLGLAAVETLKAHIERERLSF